MKRFEKILTHLLTAGLVAGMMLNFSACSKESPLRSEAHSIAPKQADEELKILKAKTYSLGKLFVNEKLITVEDGGKIQVGDDEHGTSGLHFESGDVSQDVLVRFSWESTGLLVGGAEFSPHGTVFNNPVKIKLSYKDADLTGINEQDIRIYYFNDTEGVWELIASDVNTVKKQVKGYIDHFSRYALAAQ